MLGYKETKFAEDKCNKDVDVSSYVQYHFIVRNDDIIFKVGVAPIEQKM